MTPIHKEIKTIDIKKEGSNFSGKAKISTRYDFYLKIDEIKNLPSFMVNTTSQVLFPSNDQIVVGCFEAFFFADKNIIPATDELWEFVEEAYNSITEELKVKLGSKKFMLESPDKTKELSNLEELVLSGYRLN